jgi:hypothetical protein
MVLQSDPVGRAQLFQVGSFSIEDISIPLCNFSCAKLHCMMEILSIHV